MGLVGDHYVEVFELGQFAECQLVGHNHDLSVVPDLLLALLDDLHELLLDRQPSHRLIPPVILQRARTNHQQWPFRDIDPGQAQTLDCLPYPHLICDQQPPVLFYAGLDAGQLEGVQLGGHWQAGGLELGLVGRVIQIALQLSLLVHRQLLANLAHLGPNPRHPHPSPRPKSAHHHLLKCGHILLQNHPALDARVPAREGLENGFELGGVHLVGEGEAEQVGREELGGDPVGLFGGGGVGG